MRSILGDEAFHASSGSLKDSHIITGEGEERAHKEDHIEQKQQENVQTGFGERGGKIGGRVGKFGGLIHTDVNLPQWLPVRIFKKEVGIERIFLVDEL